MAGEGESGLRPGSEQGGGVDLHNTAAASQGKPEGCYGDPSSAWADFTGTLICVYLSLTTKTSRSKPSLSVRMEKNISRH